jgi:hypothetical protein
VVEATREEEFGEEFRLSSIRLQVTGSNCAQRVELLGGDFVDLHARLIQCFAHFYRIADPDQDQKTPITRALAVVPAGHLSMQIDSIEVIGVVHQSADVDAHLVERPSDELG